MTKSEIVNAVYARVGGFSKKEAADLVDLVFETMKETLGRGEKLKISGFGNFVLRDKRERRGRNPRTGEPLTITERRVLTFKPSPILKQLLNAGDGDVDDDSDSELDEIEDVGEAAPNVGQAKGEATSAQVNVTSRGAREHLGRRSARPGERS